LSTRNRDAGSGTPIDGKAHFLTRCRYIELNRCTA